jgi:hypothetical protein
MNRDHTAYTRLNLYTHVTINGIHLTRNKNTKSTTDYEQPSVKLDIHLNPIVITLDIPKDYIRQQQGMITI